MDHDTPITTITGSQDTCSFYLIFISRPGYCEEDQNCGVCPCTCQFLSPMNFCPKIQTFNTCDLCQAGKYKSSNGTEACQSCPATTTSPPGSVSASACACGAGFTGESTCVPCATGKYKNSIANTECTRCPQGSSSARGSVSISDCKCHLGNIDGQGSGCVQCVAGKFMSLVAGPALCVDCPDGGICDNCGRGRYDAVIGTTSDVHCLEFCKTKTPNANPEGCLSCPVVYDARALTEVSALGGLFQDCVDFITD